MANLSHHTPNLREQLAVRFAEQIAGQIAKKHLSAGQQLGALPPGFFSYRGRIFIIDIGRRWARRTTRTSRTAARRVPAPAPRPGGLHRHTNHSMHAVHRPRNHRYPFNQPTSQPVQKQPPNRNCGNEIILEKILLHPLLVRLGRPSRKGMEKEVTP